MKKLNKKLGELKYLEAKLHSEFEDTLSGLMSPNYEKFSGDLLPIEIRMQKVKEDIMILLRARDILEK